MKGLCEHDRVIGHCCLECSSGKAEAPDDGDYFWDDLYANADKLIEDTGAIYACRGNQMDKSDCVLHDDCRLRETCRFHDNELPCEECSLPDYGPSLYEPMDMQEMYDKFEDYRFSGAMNRGQDPHTMIVIIANQLLDVMEYLVENKGMRNLQTQKAIGGLLPNAPARQEKESKT